MTMRPSSTALLAGITGLLLGGAVMCTVTTPALAVTDAADLVSACGEQPVCVYDGASISEPDAIAAALPQGVRVVVIPQPDQAESLQSTTLASQFRQLTGTDTVILIEDHPGSDRFAVSSNGDAASITESLYSQEEADGGTAVLSVASTLASSSSETVGSGDTPSGGGGLVFAAVAAVVVIGAVVGGVLLLRRRGKRSENRVAGSRRLEKELDAALHGESGEFIRQAIERLEERARAYPDVSGMLSQLSKHVSELFIRVRKRGTDQQVRLLQAQYHDTLAKLLKALDDDYYGDILRNPQYWGGAEDRISEVRQAVEAVDQEAVENIKQVNESRDLEFKVALDSLIKTVTEAKLSDVYTDREQ